MTSKNWGVFFFVAVALIFSLTSYMLYSEATKQKTIRLKKEQELAAKSIELAEVQAQLTKLTNQKNEMEGKLNYKVATLESAIRDSDATIKSQAEKLDSMSEENSALKREIESSEQKIAELARKTKSLETEKSELAAKIKALETAKPAEEAESTQNSDIAWTSNMDSVDLGKIVVQKNTSRAAVIQHVDSLYGFIVINAGRDEGLSPNTVVNILRNKKLIGKAVVQKSEANLSAAVILPRWTKGDVKEGDIISKF